MSPRTRLAVGLRSLLLAALLLGVGCSETTPPPLDGGTRRDGGVILPSDNWTRTTVDVGDKGLALSLTMGANDLAGMVYFDTRPFNDGPCTELGSAAPADKQRWPISYAYEGASGWTIENVDSPLWVGGPQGLQLKTSPTGEPTLLAMNGDPVPPFYCGASDLSLYTRQANGTWNIELIVADSDEALTGEPASDFGYVVGMWGALAWDNAGNPAVAYKDVHAGSLQGDDYKRADLEFAWRTGGWQNSAIDWGRSAGSFNALVFDNDNIPYVAYHFPTDNVIDSRHGLWVARSIDGGATWEQVQLLRGQTTERPTLALHPDGSLWLAYYSAPDALPKVAVLRDTTEFNDPAAWEIMVDVGDTRFDEGYFPSIAIDPFGNVAVSYYRCVRITGTLEDCDPNDDAVVFSYLDNGEWIREIIDTGDEGACGTHTSLAFDSTGRAVVGYQCVERPAAGFNFVVKAGERDPL